ncbi:MAG TPA: PilZ domain-containing protein [Terriglobales bacterium]|nr:PilZ domain-containing protein [Terriglobales bacterium]
MGKRREPRQIVRLPVRIFGTDANGRAFSENVFTADVSREGVRLSGIRSQIKAGEVIGLSHGPNKGRFAVRWVGQPGSERAGEIGLMNATPDKTMWSILLPPPRADTFEGARVTRQASGAERRVHPRMKCVNSVQLQPDGDAAPIWGKAVDLSVGGCFVEMPIPLRQGTKLKIGIWIKEIKLWATGKVVSSRPGFGIGVQFTSMSPQDTEQLRQYLRSITQLPM